MKALWIVFLSLSLGCPLRAIDKPDLDQRIAVLTHGFEELQLKQDKRVPAEALKQARGIILMDSAKGGFVFAYESGDGVAMIKDRKTQAWSPVAFVSSREASLGFQVGGDGSFQAILLMNDDAVRMLTDPQAAVGSKAQGTAATSSATASAGADGAVQIYDDRKGLFAGATVNLGSISPDHKANQIYYDKFVSMKEILFDNTLKRSDRSSQLAAKLDQYSKPEKK
jgi:lipid-binding SYLF domain-containing protein